MRFWIALTVLATVNLVGWMVDWPAVFGRDRGLVVLPANFALDGEVPASRGDHGIELRLRCDRAMATSAERVPGTFTPAIAGRWRWDDDRTLVFQAEAPLALATRYTLVLAAGGLRAADGTVQRQSLAMPFHTAPLALVEARAVDRDDSGRQIIAVVFNQTVRPAEVARQIRLSHPDGSLLPVEVLGEAPDATVRLRTDPLPAVDGIDLGLTLPKGLAGLAGPLGLVEDVTRTVRISEALRCTSLGFEGHRFRSAKTALVVDFNAPVPTDVVRAALSTVPPVELTLQQVEGGSASADGTRFLFDGAFTPGTTYSLRLAAPAGAAGRLPATESVLATVPDLAPSCRFAAGGDGGHLGSLGHRAVLVTAVNLRQFRVRAWRLYDSNIVTWRTTRWIRDLSRPVADRVIPVTGDANTAIDVPVRLDTLVGSAAIDGVYRIEISAENADTMVPVPQYWWDSQDDMVVTLSDLALSARRGPDTLTVWATSLATGTPVAGARVRIFSRKQQPVTASQRIHVEYLDNPPGAITEQAQVAAELLTDADGLARFTGLVCDADDEPAVILADQSDRRGLTWLDLRQGAVRDPLADTSGRPWTGQEAFLHPDRGLIRPGETIHWRAIVRAADGAVPPPFPVRWTIIRPDARVFTTSTASLDRDGCVLLDVALPDVAMTGTWTALVAIPGGTELGRATWQVEDVIPDRLAVTLRLDERIAGSATAAVRGDWLFGSPAAGLPVGLALRIDPIPVPAGDGWWTCDDATLASEFGLGAATGDRLPDPTPTTVAADGSAAVALGDLAALVRARSGPAMPWRLSVTASVQEAGGRAVSASRTASIDPLPAYLTIRPGTAVAGAACPVALRLLTGDGQPATGSAQVELTMQRVRWETSVTREEGRYQYHSTRILTAVGAPMQIVLRDGQGAAEVTCPDGGTYVLSARIADRRLLVSGWLYAGAEAWTASISRDHPERAEVMPVGRGPATAGVPVEVDIRSPFTGTLLLTVETDRVVETRCLALTANATRVSLTPTAAWGSTAYVTATVVRAVDPSGPWRVHRAYGCAPIQVEGAARRATVAIAAQPEVRPGAAFACAVQLTASDGAPLADAAVTVAAVDEGLLRPVGFRTPDPTTFFWGKRRLGTEAVDIFGDLLSEVPAAGAATPGGDEAVSLRHRPPVAMRRVAPVALWSGTVRSDATGLARAEFTVPAAFSGRLRLMAVAAAGARTGSAEAGVAVRSPVLVQASLPRFLAPGDRCRVPVTVFAIGAGGTASVDLGGAAQQLTVPADGSAVAWFDLVAPAEPGELVVVASAAIGNERHAETTRLPVRPALSVVTVGGMAVVDADHPVVIPAPALLAIGARSASVAVDALPDLSLAVKQLLAYPHGCAEQTTSTCFALLARPTTDANQRAAVASRLRAGFERLALMTTNDGGLAMWPGGREAWPWAAVYALHLCHEAATGSYPVPEHLRDNLLRFTRGLLERTDADLLATRCYATWVLALHGRPAPGAMQRLAAEIERKTAAAAPECRLHLAAAWLTMGDRERGAALIPPGIGVRTGRLDGGDCGSPVRDRALALIALLAADPAEPRIHRLAQDLARSDDWRSTQDDAWAMLALARYRSIIQPVPFTRVDLLTGGAVVETGTTTLAWLGQAIAADTSVRLAGPPGARGWLTWTASGLPSAPPAAVSDGLTIERTFSVPPGQWRRGDLLTVTLAVQGIDRSYRSVVVEDLLCAGLEIENPRLLTSAAQAATRDGTDNAAHVEMRDDRLVMIGNVPASAAWQHRYLARVVGGGSFTLPPATAECMNDRTVRAVGATTRIEIGER